jgi:hypothetical protein
MSAVVVASLPSLHAVVSDASSSVPKGKPSAGSSGVQPKTLLTLPHGDPNRLPKDVLSFCFPDLEQLKATPFHYEHTGAEEFTFTMTPKDAPRMHGYVRRYHVGFPSAGGRLDCPPHTSSDLEAAAAAPAFQCICILSERFVKESVTDGGTTLFWGWADAPCSMLYYC